MLGQAGHIPPGCLSLGAPQLRRRLCAERQRPSFAARAGPPGPRSECCERRTAHREAAPLGREPRSGEPLLKPQRPVGARRRRGAGHGPAVQAPSAWRSTPTETLQGGREVRIVSALNGATHMRPHPRRTTRRYDALGCNNSRLRSPCRRASLFVLDMMLAGPAAILQVPTRPLEQTQPLQNRPHHKTRKLRSGFRPGG